MRLIDADRLMDRLRGNVLIDVTTELEKTIADQPTAFDKEKVKEELNAGKFVTADGDAIGKSVYIRIDRAVEIVEKGGIE